MHQLVEARHRLESASRDVVVLDDISKRFGSTQALRNVSLTFRAGEVHAVLGENGAGKSTIGKIMGGLVHPDEGRLLVDGTEIRLRSVIEARSLGFAMVFQELSLIPDLTVRENICLGAESPENPFSLVKRKGEADQCRALLAEYDFSFDLDARVRSLSVANQQLIEVVKALASRPRVLILDEPTAMLSVREKEKLLDIMQNARQRGVAVIFITHHVEEVVEVADRVSLMKDGALVDSFPVTGQTDADFIVRKLIGSSRSLDSRKRTAQHGSEVFSLYNLSGVGNRSIDISVSEGQVVSLYGVVGSGCEQVARGAVGLANIRPAKMMLDGSRYEPGSPAYAARRGVSYLPSGRAANCILPSRSTRENLMISQLDQVQRFGVVRRAAERHLTQSLLARFRTRYANYDDPITSLSGGNQQKVMIARCLGPESKLIVLEDPTAGVDIGSKQDIHELIRDRVATGLAVFLISSDLLETITISDIIYTVVRGQVVRKYENPTIADEAAMIADVLGG